MKKKFTTKKFSFAYFHAAFDGVITVMSIAVRQAYHDDIDDTV